MSTAQPLQATALSGFGRATIPAIRATRRTASLDQRAGGNDTQPAVAEQGYTDAPSLLARSIVAALAMLIAVAYLSLMLKDAQPFLPTTWPESTSSEATRAAEPQALRLDPVLIIGKPAGHTQR